MNAVAEPRAAATVMLLRDGDAGLEVYLIQRHHKSGFLGGAHAFPGGKVDDADRATDDPRRTAAVRETLEEVGVELLADTLSHWGRWVTPEAEPRRFDASFYVAEIPEDQDATPSDRESLTGGWYAPRDAIEAMHRREVFLAPPTLRSLEMLALLGDVAEAHAWATASGDPVIRPTMRTIEGRLEILLPGHPEHPEDATTTPGPTRMALVGRAWEYPQVAA